MFTLWIPSTVVAYALAVEACAPRHDLVTEDAALVNARDVGILMVVLMF